MKATNTFSSCPVQDRDEQQQRSGTTTNGYRDYLWLDSLALVVSCEERGEECESDDPDVAFLNDAMLEARSLQDDVLSLTEPVHH